MAGLSVREELGGEWKARLRAEGITWPTIENIEKVIDAGFEVVHFDRDADTVDGLQTWEW
ncbi:hypothetical protein [Klebsiella pneumoniae]|uniref:DUF5983 family protein n=1 Tax=Klebsiella pneumoniae TaxID=573 RepID=UPI00313DCBCC